MHVGDLLRRAMPGAGVVHRNAVVAAVVAVVVVAYGLGTIQERIFTCGDFTISGNSEPPGCTPGGPSLNVGRG